MPGERNVRFIDTASLSIGYEVTGPEDGYPVVLLHGWPDDIRTWDRMLLALHGGNYRTFTPYLRGFGATHFRDAKATRNGQLSALGEDAIDFANALELERFAIIGHDWGGRAAYIASCLLGPERISHCAALSVGWGTNDPYQKLELRQVQNYWYHWYMALDRGADLVRNDRVTFTRYIWSIWNAGWKISDDEFNETARSFENPDWAEVVLHSYRARWGLAPTDARLDVVEEHLQQRPEIFVPTLVIHGAADSCNDPSTSESKERFFKSSYNRILLHDVGHFPQRQAADVVSNHLLSFFSRAESEAK